MQKIIAALSSGLLITLLAIGNTASAQVGVGVGSNANAQVGTSPLMDDTDLVVDVEADVSADKGPDMGGAGASAGAAGGASASVEPFTLSQREAAAASLDAESATLGAASVRTSEDLSVFATSKLKRDANIESIEVARDEVSLSYRQPARFLGFIPTDIRATARVTNEGRVDVDYPWYRLFFAVDGASEAEAALETRVQELTANANGSFTVALEAAILEAMHRVLSAGATGTATAGVTADMAGRASDVTATGSASVDLSEEGALDGAGANASGEASAEAGAAVE